MGPEADCVSMIDTVLAVARQLFAAIAKFKQAKAEKRQRIAAYLDSIGLCIAEVSSGLRRGEVPYARCSELATYAEKLPAALGDEIGQDQSRELAAALKQAGHARALAMELANTEGKNAKAAQLQKLDEAAGLFVAMANTVRAL